MNHAQKNAQIRAQLAARKTERMFSNRKPKKSTFWLDLLGFIITAVLLAASIAFQI